MHNIPKTFIIFFLAISAACTSPESRNQTPVTINGRPALVITTDFESGALAIVDPQKRNGYAHIAAIHSDSVCRYDHTIKIPFIIHRWGADAVAIPDPANNWSIKTEYSVEAGSNPQDIASVSRDRAYVARFNRADLLIVNPLRGTRIGHVDLTPYADEDGVPEVTWLYHLEGKVYALLARLHDFKPTDSSTILIIDGPTGQVEDAIPLTHTNPSGKLRYADGLGQFVLIETGGFASLGGAETIDGIIELFDPQTKSLSGPIITSQTLGGDLIDAVIHSENKGYAIVEAGEDDTLHTRLVSFDPEKGTRLNTMAKGSGFAYSSLELTPDGKEVWLTDRTRTNPGIRVFDTVTEAPLIQNPIDVGLPPFMICFVEDDVSDSVEADGGAAATTDHTDTFPSTDTEPEAPTSDGGDVPDASITDTALVMEATTGDEPNLSEGDCPVPQAPAFTIIQGSTKVRWHVPNMPLATIEMGWNDDLQSNSPTQWVAGDEYTFENRNEPYAVKLFARTIATDCETERFFNHVYNVRTHYPPEAEAIESTAIPMSDSRFIGWATGWVEPVSYGEEVLEEWRKTDAATGPATGTAGDILCTGRAGHITMTFDAPIKDLVGFDFALFENGITPDFLDLAKIAVSSDGQTFTWFDTVFKGTEPLGPFDTQSTTRIGQIAGKYQLGYGQPFDLQVLANKPEVVDGRIDLLDIRYIKIKDIPGDGSVQDSFGNPIYDPYPCTTSAGFDLEAIGVIND